MSFGDNVKLYRTKKGLTQGELGEKSGLTLGQVSKIERGLGNPKLDTIERLMGALECDASEIISGKEGTRISEFLNTLFKRTERLPESDKTAILHIIKALITAHNINLAMNEWQDPREIKEEEMHLKHLEDYDRHINRFPPSPNEEK